MWVVRKNRHQRWPQCPWLEQSKEWRCHWLRQEQLWEERKLPKVTQASISSLQSTNRKCLLKLTSTGHLVAASTCLPPVPYGKALSYEPWACCHNPFSPNVFSSFHCGYFFPTEIRSWSKWKTRFSLQKLTLQAICSIKWR